jgi:hypothetical protein
MSQYELPNLLRPSEMSTRTKYMLAGLTITVILLYIYREDISNYFSKSKLHNVSAPATTVVVSPPADAPTTEFVPPNEESIVATPKAQVVAPLNNSLGSDMNFLQSVGSAPGAWFVCKVQPQF